MPRNRRKNGIFDSYGLPKPIIETVQTTARTTSRTTASAGTRLALEYGTTSKQLSSQNGHKLTQSTLMPEPAHGLTYALRQRSDAIEHISALKKTCKSMARYFKENSVTSFSRPMPINSVDGYFMIEEGKKMFFEPIATYKTSGQGKTYGFIRFEGGEVKFKAESGWGPKKNHDDSLRDNEFLSSQVLQFCNSLGFRLPGHCWDKTEIGQYAACHVEKKLMLMLICDLIYDVETEDIAMFRLEELWERRLKAQIYLDKDPCDGCRNFALELEQGTGINFKIITAKTVVDAEWVKKHGGKQLQAKGRCQLFDYSTPKTRPRKRMDYSIPEIPNSEKITSGGKRKRILDDDDADETFVPKNFRPKAKKLQQKPRKADKINKTKPSTINYRSGKPNPTYNAPKDLSSNILHSLLPQQRSTRAEMKPAKPLGSTKYSSASPSRGISMDNHSLVIDSGLPNRHAVPSERSRAIAMLQQAKKGLLARPINHNLPVFHRVQSPSPISTTKIYTSSEDADSESLRSSRTASPQEFAITPPSRAVKALPTPVTTPSGRYAERCSSGKHVTPSRSIHNSTNRAPTNDAGLLSSERFSTPESVTPRRYVTKSCKQVSKKSVENLYSTRFGVQSVTPSKSVQETYNRTLTKPATKSAVPSSRPSKRINSRTVDLNTSEPSPLLKIKQFQYSPPPKSSKHRSEKTALPVPFRLPYNNN